MRKLLSLIVVLQFVSALPVMATDKGVSSCSSVATTKSESPAGQVKQQKKNQEDSSDMKARLATTKPEKVSRTKTVKLGRHGNTAMARERILQPEVKAEFQD